MKATPRTDRMIGAHIRVHSFAPFHGLPVEGWVRYDELCPVLEAMGELERELAEAKADAARYRWLRDDADSLTLGEVIPEMIFVDPSETDAAFDAAIDAAMKGDKNAKPDV